MIKYSSCHKVAVEEFPEIPHYVCPKCAQPCEVVETPASQQPEYSLNCSQCGGVYLSSEGFPKLQFCPKCLGSLYPSQQPNASPDLLTDEEIKQIASLYWLEKYRNKMLGQFTLEDTPEYGRRVSKAQDVKTYPLAFEAGRKAQAEKDRAEIEKKGEVLNRNGRSNEVITDDELHENLRIDSELKGQAELARDLGISRSYLCDILHYRRAIGDKVLRKLKLKRKIYYTPI